MTKPTVHYSAKDTDSFIVVGCSAYVIALDHPTMGHSAVRTSTVQSFDQASGVFETLNTKYVPDVTA